MNTTNPSLLFVESRQNEIAKTVEERGEVTVKELADVFSVSSATIRKDLASLERRKTLTRTHGGAIRRISFASHEDTYAEKEVQNLAEKKAIALKALEFIDENDVICLDTGTTVLELAKALAHRDDLTIVTNDLRIAFYLEQNSQSTVILLGGRIRKNFSCIVGEFAIEELKHLNIHTAFIGSNGVDMAKGCSTPSLDVAEVKKKMMEASSRAILLADHAKIKKSTLAQFASLSDFSVFITDKPLSSVEENELKDKNVELVIAGG